MLNLPLELCMSIVEYMDANGIISLCQTCTNFSCLLTTQCDNFW